MPKNETELAISEETLEHLDDVRKGKPRRFVMICKGQAIVSLVVYKKGSVEKYKKEAKEAGSGTVSYGVVDGKGPKINFKLSRADKFEEEPTTTTKVKLFLKETADLTCTPSFEIVEELGPLLDGDDPLVARFVPLQESAQMASKEYPPRATEINGLCTEIAKILDQDPSSDAAYTKIGVLEALLSSLHFPGNKPPPPTIVEKSSPTAPVFDEQAAKFKVQLTDILKMATPYVATIGNDVKILATQAREFAEKQNYNDANARLKQIVELLVAAKAAPPPGTATVDGQDQMATFTKLVNDVKPKLDLLKTGDEPAKLTASETVALIKQASGYTAKGDFEQAFSLLTQAEKLVTTAAHALEERKKKQAEALEKERLEKERLEKERLEKERLEKERLEKERLEKERLEKERLEKERLEKERLEKERLEKERLEKERLEKERLEKERLEKERLEKERLEKERLEKERLEKERLEKERLEKERLEKERKAEEFLNDKYVSRRGELDAFVPLETANLDPALKQKAIELGKLDKQVADKFNNGQFVEAEALFHSLELIKVLDEANQMSLEEGDKYVVVHKKIESLLQTIGGNPFLASVLKECDQKWREGWKKYEAWDMDGAHALLKEVEITFNSKFAQGSQQHFDDVMTNAVGRDLDSHPRKDVIEEELAELHKKAELAEEQRKAGLIKAADAFTIEIEHSVGRLKRIADECVAYDNALPDVKKMVEDMKARVQPAVADEVETLLKYFTTAEQFALKTERRYVEAFHLLEEIKQEYPALKKTLGDLERITTEQEKLLKQDPAAAVKELRERIKTLKLKPVEIVTAIKAELEPAELKLDEADKLLVSTTAK